MRIEIFNFDPQTRVGDCAAQQLDVRQLGALFRWGGHKSQAVSRVRSNRAFA
jgi:hypothetical protein